MHIASHKINILTSNSISNSYLRRLWIYQHFPNHLWINQNSLCLIWRIMVRDSGVLSTKAKKKMWSWCTDIVDFTLNVLLQKISTLPHHPLATWKVYQFTHLNLSLKVLAWNSSDCFESFSPLNNVWIDQPLMPSSDVTHYPKTG